MKRYMIIIFLLALSVKCLSALEVPELKGRVNDYADLLTEEEKQKLENTLKGIETNTSAQLVLLTVISLMGDDLEDFSMRVSEDWQIGQKDKDNGVILLVALSERRIRIEVGYGLESVLPDGRCGTIIRNVITPAFRNGKYYEGLNDAFLAMNSYITGSDNIDQFEKKYASSEEDDVLAGIIVIIIFIIIFAFIFIGIGKRSSRRKGRGVFWIGGSGWNSSGGGGFSSGGFSGGGGSFGGGGASGGW